MKNALIILGIFVVVSCTNSYLTTLAIDGTVFTEELVDIKSIFIRVIITWLVTQMILKRKSKI